MWLRWAGEKLKAATKSTRDIGRRSDILAALSDRIRQIEDPDELAYAAAQLLGEELQVSRAGYGTIDTSNETITIQRDWNAPGIKSLAGMLHFRDYGSYIEDLKRGETVVFENADTDPRTAASAEALKAISAQSIVNMPVTEHGGFVALLYLNHATSRRWSDDELALVSEVADRTRTAVERLRAEQSLRDNAARLMFLDRLGSESGNATDAESLMRIATRLLGEHLGVSICAYADMEPDQDHFTIRGDWSAPGSPSIVGHYSLADFGRLAVANLSAGEPLVINDNRKELPEEEAKTFLNIGIAATICMPLVKQGRLTALMAIHDKQPRIWSEREQALLAEVTERCWAHIERVRSEQAARDSAERLRLATDAASIGTWDYNPVTGQLRWDDKCKAFFGLPPEAEISYDGAFLAGLHPDDRGRADQAVQMALDPSHSGQFHLEYRTVGIRDGKERWIAASGDTLFEAGRAVRFIGTVIDITARKRTERHLKIMNDTGAAVAAELDLDKIVQTITDAGVELSGAQFGAFFYNVLDDLGGSYMLYALSGAPRSAFENYRCHGRRLYSSRPFSARGWFGRKTSSRIRATAGIRHTAACQRATCRSVPISLSQSLHAPVRFWVVCSSATPNRAFSRPNMRLRCSDLPAMPRPRSTTPDCFRRRKGSWWNAGVLRKRCRRLTPLWNNASQKR